jgi:nitrate/nitrite transporter NarK
MAQLGAFVTPVIWGISKDSTGSYHLGLTLIPLLFITGAAIAIHLRRQIRLKELALIPVIVPA